MIHRNVARDEINVVVHCKKQLFHQSSHMQKCKQGYSGGSMIGEHGQCVAEAPMPQTDIEVPYGDAPPAATPMIMLARRGPSTYQAGLDPSVLLVPGQSTDRVLAQRVGPGLFTMIRAYKPFDARGRPFPVTGVDPFGDVYRKPQSKMPYGVQVRNF